MGRVALVLCLLLGLAVPVLAQSGDVNGDGRIDERDIQLIDAYLNGTQLLQDAQIVAADADRDGKITATDRDLLQRRILGLQARSGPKNSQVDLTSADAGVVVDKATGAPLAGVEVALPDEGISVRTDSQGRFRLPGSTSGKQILTARATNYAPSSVTTQNRRGFQLELERLNPRLAVLDDDLHHLGDDNYDRRSSGAREFRLPAEGTRYVKSFVLARLPQSDLQLRIGSIIGIDTEDAIAAGQSNLPPSSRRQAGSGGVRVSLNGQMLRELVLNGDNLTVTLPRTLLRPGTNQIALEAARLDRGAVVFNPSPDSLFGKLSSAELQDLGLGSGALDYDDIEFTHLVIVDPAGGALPESEPR
ncbi:dockerin type I domain-containing protein [Gloeobacter kilaueensis]|uniref:Dockerin domain-containing protein n=1 Tax=Gloeobacter kilaueensis (strain ATCC BAA-2537 / CCAP 1431/1 / ULC 316 / JS1) TaxID=1183438 RepID=U5QIX1_GLOK1|nr:dockerin type I domain-containing protein [Gloeobacter kilaueensis]AGY57640.1 hypothetical protein GKIL_1394 [Gloeobacter kilaueensis JS1]